MEPPPPVTAVQARWALLAVFFCAAFLELAAPQAGTATVNVLASFLMFLWYCRDRDATGRQRSLARNIGVIALPFLTVPVYLMRHRPWRGQVRALLRFIGYVLLMVLAALLGTLAAALLAGLFGLHFGTPGAF